MERFIQAYVTREQVVRSGVPWAQLRAHIVQSFLCVDEQGALRDELEKIKQSPFELNTLIDVFAKRRTEHFRLLNEMLIKRAF